MHGYIEPHYRNHPDAVDFDQYLADNLKWSVEDFGGGYAWSAPIPPRNAWRSEVEALNLHLGTVSA